MGRSSINRHLAFVAMTQKLQEVIPDEPVKHPKLKEEVYQYCEAPKDRNVDYNDSGWWFGTFFMLPYVGNNHPN